jgi:hypothetical protein
LAGQLIHASSNLTVLPAYRRSMPMRDLASRLATLNLAATMLILAGTILLMVAIFSDRDRKRAVG